MKFTRLYTGDTEDPYKGIRFESFEKDFFAVSDDAGYTDSECGSVYASSEKDFFYLPSFWDTVSKNIFADRIAIREGVPAFVKPVVEEDVPAWLWKKEPDWEKLEQLPRTLRTVGEKDSRDVFNRIAGGWTYTAWKKGLFPDAEEAKIFYDEIRYILVHRLAFPETMQWKFIGTEHSYGYREKAVPDYSSAGDLGFPGQMYQDSSFSAGKVSGISGGTGRQDLSDVNGKMFDWGNFVRSLPVGLTGVKSYGPVRKLILDATHPEIESFIDWKRHEEHRVAALVTGSRVLHKYLKDIALAATEDIAGIYASDMQYNERLKSAVEAARRAFVPEHSIRQVIHLAKQGIHNIDFSVFDTEWDGEAYRTVAGNGINTAVRVPHALVEAAQDELLFDCWTLRHPVTGKPCGKTGVQSIWDSLAYANWYAAEPTVEFDTVIQEWNTCKESGRINSSAPSGGYMFQDNSSCFGVTFNLSAFIHDPLEASGGWQVAPDNSDISPAVFQSIHFSHAVRLMTVACDITHTIAAEGDMFADSENRFRALGLNMCDLAPVLMRLGLAYDSDEARTFAGAVAGLMTGEAWAASAELAADIGPFAAWPENTDSMKRVLKNYLAIANGKHDGYDGLTIAPPALINNMHPAVSDVIESAGDAFARAVKNGEKNGYRNAFVTLISPVSKSAMAMGGRVSGIDPENTVVMYDGFADEDGGGEFRHRLNPNIPYALRRCGYSKEQIRDITGYVLGAHTLRGAPAINHEKLVSIGMTQTGIDALESVIAHSYDIRFAFNRWTLGDDFCRNIIGLSLHELDKNAFDLLPLMGFSPEEIDEANAYCCGALTLEGAPHLTEEHLRIFDCAVPPGRKGSRKVGPAAHILMAAAAGAFINGGVGTAIQLDYSATVDMIKDFYFLAWSLGMKNISLYRQGAKLCQTRFRDMIPATSEKSSDETAQDKESREKKVVYGILSSPSAKRIPLLAGQIVRHLKAKKRLKDIADNAEVQTALPNAVAASEISAETWETPDAAIKKSLPPRRKGYTQKAVVGGHKIYLRTGEYDDGTLGEIFIDMHKEGASFRSLLNNFAVAVSIGLQYGVPLEEFVDTFAFTRFEPNGAVTGNESVTNASSVLDYIFRDLAVSYLGRADLADIGSEIVHEDIYADVQHNSSRDLHLIDPDTLKIIKQAVSGGYSRGNLRRVQERLLGKISANSNLAACAALEDERIKELGFKYEDVDESDFIDDDIQNGNSIFDVSEEAVRSAIREAREKGYEGNCCSACGRMTLLKISHFMVCDTCSFIQENSGR